MPVTYADITPLDTLWLWHERIPLGEVTLLAGEGGVSKGLALVDLAARVTTGAPMPGEDEGTDPASVIMITPEDDLQETVTWRLRAAGAELGRVHDLTYLEKGGSPFELSADTTHRGNVAELRAMIDAIGDVRLVVIDPMMACLAYGTVTTNLGARRAVKPLQRMAKETGAAVVMSHHVVKSGTVAGSKGLTDALRVVYRVRRDPDNAAFRIMSLEKSNVLGATEDLRYTLAGEGHGTHVVWLGREQLEERRTGWRDRLAERRAAKAVKEAQSAHPGLYEARCTVNGATFTLAAGVGAAEAQEACQRQAGPTPLAWKPGGDGFTAGDKWAAYTVTPQEQAKEMTR